MTHAVYIRAGRLQCAAIARHSTMQRRRRRAKSPAAPAAAGTLLAPPPPARLPGGLEMGPDAAFQVHTAVQEQLRGQAERLNGSLNGSSGVAASAVASPAEPPSTAVLAPAQQGSSEEQQGQPPKAAQPGQQQERRARRSGRAAAAAADEQQQRRRGRGRKGAPKQARRLAIPPKEEGLMRWVRAINSCGYPGWYGDATRAAEQAYKLSGRGRGKAAAPSLGAALHGPVKAWLGERLEYQGFEGRPFPSLAPLGRPSPHALHAAGSLDGWSVEPPAGGCGSMLAHVFAEWAQEAGGALPILANQWPPATTSVWEPRSAGALLQECHAAHAHCGAADEHAQAMAQLYEQFAREAAGLPAVAGRRSARGTLRGAAATYTVEALVGEGRALQVAAAHHLADNYASVLGACYTEEGSGEELCLHQMGAGLQAAAMAAAALEHGDDAGLRLPPELAPVQAVIVPIWFGRGRAALEAEAQRLRDVLEAAGVRAAVDARRTRPGVRFGAADRAGVPLRIEVGLRDVAARTCTLVPRRSRDDPAPARLAGVSTEGGEALVEAVHDALREAQQGLYWGAQARLESAVVDVSSFMELRDVVEAGLWARGPWAGSLEDELAVQEETGATLRCFPLVQPASLARGFSTCLYSGYQAAEVAIFARAL